jgi:hypothetical protein
MARPEPSLPPTLVAVDEDAGALARVEEELQRRYACDYRILCESSPQAALKALEEMRADGDPGARWRSARSTTTC